MSHAIDVLGPKPQDEIFDNLKGLLRPNEVCELLGVKLSTIYDWHHRPFRRNIPKGLFIKFNRKLLIRRDVLKSWVLEGASR